MRAYAWGPLKVSRATRSQLPACILAALGATQAIGDPVAGGPSPRIDYDLSLVAEEQRPAGGNVTSTPTAAPADNMAFNPATDEGAMTVLGASINGHEMRGDTIVTVRDGRTLIPVDDLKRWRLVFTGTPIQIDDQAFAPLNSVAGLTFRIDKRRAEAVRLPPRALR